MAIQQSPVRTSEARQTVLVDTFTDGLLGPEVPMLGPVADGGHVVWNSTPGCWGPMITPSIRGGHEVCQPVAVDGAKAGDAVVIRIKDIEVTSLATSSGNDQPMEGRFNGDPYCAAVCPGCGAEWPETRLEGIGEAAPDVAPALRSVLPVVAGEHAERTRRLRAGDEVALLLPVSGG